MDFLDPKKEKRSRLMLLVGYCLVALGISIATLVLYYQSKGYDIDRQGNVTQNGLVFISSQPSNATIYLSGSRYKSNTDTRVSIPAGSYLLRIVKAGYRDWQRPIAVNGGDVQHFDYPFLFPTTLKTSSLGALPADPSVSTQSPDRRWLILGRSESSGSFLEYDLKDPSKPVVTTLTLPDSSFTPGDATGAQTWGLVKWAADNQHVLLLHTFTSNGSIMHEYVLLDRDTPANSLNMTSTLKLSQAETLTLFNDRVAQFYVYNSEDSTLARVNASDGSVVNKLTHVLAYKPYADDKILYVTDQSPTGKTIANQVSVILQDGQKTMTLRTLPAGATTYLLDLAQYSGDWYVVAGSSSDGSVYLFKNPQNQTTLTSDGYPAPWRRLPIDSPSYVSFSSSTQFVVAESGQSFVVYDLENIAQYRYTALQPMDKPQTHATWMDGNRLQFVSNGKLVVFDYDYRNAQTLMPANPAYLPIYAPDYSYVFTLKAANADSPQPALTTTPLTVD